MATVTCAACGALNDGTKFCESCGAPAAEREAKTPRILSPTGPQLSSASATLRHPSRAVPTNVMAILALVFGIGGGLLGIIFGHIALGQIERTGEQGRGLAMTGLVFGYLGLGVGVIIFIGIVATVPRY